MANKRYTHKDWLELGLSTLKHDGPSALTVDTLCASANKTRGSFYFHFENVEAFHTRLAQFWKTQFTDQLIATTSNTSARKDLLNQLAARLDLDLESAIRKLAQIHPHVQLVISEADEARTKWLSKLYNQLGNYDGTDAHYLAQIEYAAFVGFRLVNPNLTPNQSRELYNAFLRFTSRA